MSSLPSIFIHRRGGVCTFLTARLLCAFQKVIRTIMSAVNGSYASSAQPSAHAQRYDRQLRLWASSGQASLESSSIVVLGATHLGACILKNLVLPGIGTFHLIDACDVDSEDIGNNFFIGSNAKGKSRAKEVTEKLVELNPQVHAHAILQDPQAWLTEANLDQYTLIIAVNQPKNFLIALADRAWHAKAGMGIPLMCVTGSGLMGHIDIQVKEAGIIETHPESIIDLRLTQPWPELESFVEAFDIDTQDSMIQSHIPFIVILLRKLNEWKLSHRGQLPQPSTDRKAFSDSVKTFNKETNVDAENVEEALSALGQHVWRPIASGKAVPPEISTLLLDEACTGISENSSNFWLLMRALKDFIEQGDGTLPVSGSLPDFKSLSSTYVQLQQLYRSKFARDVATLQAHLDKVLSSVNLPHNAISQDEIESFAKHAAYVKLIRSRPMRERLSNPDREAISKLASHCKHSVSKKICRHGFHGSDQPHHLPLLHCFCCCR